MAQFDEHTDLADLASEDVLDSRDLEDMRQSLQAIADARAEWLADEDRDPDDEPEDLDDDQRAALQVLDELAKEVGGLWPHGETLIRESYFEDYVRELVTDCGYVPRDIPGWIEIDWEATARNVRADYSSAEIAGTTFYFRYC